MLFIKKNTINRLAEQYKEPDMFTCYAMSQSFASVTSRAILLMNHKKIIVLFLNAFSSRVVQKIEFPFDGLENSKLRYGILLSAIWSFDFKGDKWRFSIIKKIMTLGTMQGDFLRVLKQNLKG